MFDRISPEPLKKGLVKKTMIKAIFLDWGATLVSGFEETDEQIDELLKPYNLKWADVFKDWRNFYLLRSLGRIKTDDEMFDKLKKILNLPDTSVLEKIKKLQIDSHIITPETIKTIKNLKKHYKIGIISNNIYEWVVPVLNKYQAEKLFDGIIVSSKTGFRKPDARIFAESLRALSVDSSESVFVSDELSEDLVGSKGMGMTSIWLINPQVKSEWIAKESKEKKVFEPDAIIYNLNELPSIIKKFD